jgi:hypothetical protein
MKNVDDHLTTKRSQKKKRSADFPWISDQLADLDRFYKYTPAPFGPYIVPPKPQKVLSEPIQSPKEVDFSDGDTEIEYTEFFPKGAKAIQLLFPRFWKEQIYSRARQREIWGQLSKVLFEKLAEYPLRQQEFFLNKALRTSVSEWPIKVQAYLIREWVQQLSSTTMDRFPSTARYQESRSFGYALDGHFMNVFKTDNIRWETVIKYASNIHEVISAVYDNELDWKRVELEPNPDDKPDLKLKSRDKKGLFPKAEIELTFDPNVWRPLTQAYDYDLFIEYTRRVACKPAAEGVLKRAWSFHETLPELLGYPKPKVLDLKLRTKRSRNLTESELYSLISAMEKKNDLPLEKTFKRPIKELYEWLSPEVKERMRSRALRWHQEIPLTAHICKLPPPPEHRLLGLDEDNPSSFLCLEMWTSNPMMLETHTWTSDDWKHLEAHPEDLLKFAGPSIKRWLQWGYLIRTWDLILGKKDCPFFMGFPEYFSEHAPLNIGSRRKGYSTFVKQRLRTRKVLIYKKAVKALTSKFKKTDWLEKDRIYKELAEFNPELNIIIKKEKTSLDNNTTNN